MKSLTVSVFAPAWSWINTPEMQWLTASYAQSLATRDSVKTRRLIASPWYRSRWGEKFNLAGDQNAKQRYENDQGGHRIATSVGGSNTGEGGDVIVVDDPHNVKEAESDAVRVSALEWWDEVMSTRLNNLRTGSKVIVMQRVHEDDLAGHVLEEFGYTHLCLPMKFEAEKKCVVEVTGFEDPRKEEGELLWPERADDEVVETLESALGPYASAGQLQQCPAPRSGNLFNTEEFVIVDAVPGPLVKVFRAWDKASTEGAGCFSVGAKMGKLADGRFIVLHIERGQWNTTKREEHILASAQADGTSVEIAIEQEPGSSGVDSAQASIKMLAGFIVTADRPTGDKVVRADPYSVQVGAGNVLILRGAWNKAFIHEHRFFPNGKYKDQVDSTSLAFKKLTGPGVQVFV
jgi:predicted phage terminase large subunit-like protein